jgi:hypothetical protein
MADKAIAIWSFAGFPKDKYQLALVQIKGAVGSGLVVESDTAGTINAQGVKASYAYDETNGGTLHVQLLSKPWVVPAGVIKGKVADWLGMTA